MTPWWETIKKAVSAFMLIVLLVTGAPLSYGQEATDEDDEESLAAAVVGSQLKEEGDEDGALGDVEREQMSRGELKPEDAEQIPDTSTGRYSVRSNQSIFSQPNARSKVVGYAYPGETFSVVTMTGGFFRVRFADGRIGYVRSSEILGEKPKKTKVPTETECENCVPPTPRPTAIDAPVKDLSDIVKHIDKKPRRPAPPPRTHRPDITDDIKGLSSGRLAKLIKASNYQARVCRVPADYLRRRYGRGKICGNVAKGKCYAGVKDALVQAGITKTRIPGVSAKHAHYHGHLRKAGMKNIMSSLTQKHGRNLKSIARNAPAGAVLVYEGGSHGHGHIEIKTSKSQYCSDFCKSRPINEYAARKLIAVYIP